MARRATHVLIAVTVLFASALSSSSSWRLSPAFAQEDSGDATEPPPAEDIAPVAPAPDPSVPWWELRGGDLDPTLQFGASIEYQTFWEARTEAFADPGYEEELLMADYLDGKPLAAELAALKKREAAGQAQMIVVQNSPTVVYTSQDEFVIFDSYVSRSYLVDARTRQALGDGPNTPPSSSTIAYHMRKLPDAKSRLGYRWKIVDSVGITN
jgi:hypothetical protein